MKTLSGGTVSPERASKRTAATADQDSVEKAAKLKARQNLEFASDKGKNVQPNSFIFQYDTCLFNSTKSFGILLGNNDLEINNSLELLRSTEYQRMVDSKNLMFNDKKEIEDVVSVSSNDEYFTLQRHKENKK